jgi:GTP pyrophosphokinase
MSEEERIAHAYQRLIKSYLASPHRKKVDLIERAFKFARQAHEGVKRISGEPYIMHPLAVAQIVSEELGLGSTSICAALLHDVVEDTEYTMEDIRNIFGPKIAEIVDGVTKISGGIFGDQASVQAENFKKLLLTMSNDIRVILVKIADRLQGMRTLGSQLPAKQYKIAGETLYIYAPLANRLGLNKIKEELEDLAFRYEQPAAYTQIQTRLSEQKEDLKGIFDEFTAPIREKLDAAGLRYDIKARIKTPYSIWCKMQNKKVPFEEVYDLLAVRIIFDTERQEDEVEECWHIYTIASSIYRPHPERLRDWLSHPKANGYQALQTTLMSKRGRWIELQIRSRRMDEIAEQGFAAHWKYKDGGKEAEDSENELDRWLATIKEILDDPQPNAVDFLNTIKLNLYASEIFVVTPKGDFKTMPAGSTVLDFAFAIHTFLGTHCIGAKVNHKLEGLGYHIESGDQVEILTGKQSRVTKEWYNYATTAKARSKISTVLKRHDRELQHVGEERLAEFFRSLDIERSSFLEDRLCEKHGVELREELYQAIGDGSVVLDKEDKNILLGKKSKNWLRHLPLIGKKKKVATPVQQNKTVVLQVEVQAEDVEDVMKELQKMGLEPIKKLT